MLWRRGRIIHQKKGISGDCRAGDAHVIAGRQSAAQKRTRYTAQVGGTSGAPDTGTTGTGSDAAVSRTVGVTVGDTYGFFIPQTPLFDLKS